MADAENTVAAAPARLRYQLLFVCIFVALGGDKKNVLDLGCVQLNPAADTVIIITVQRRCPEQRHAISYYMNQQHAARAWHSASYAYLT